MGSLTNYAENALLDHVFNTAYTPAATLYLALATNDPGEGATGAAMNEVANSGNYARTAISFGAAATRRITQNAVVTFPQANGSWGTVTHWAIVDTGTYGAGNVLAYGALAAQKTIVSGNTPSVASGQVYVEFSAGEISDFLSNTLLDKMFRNQAYAKPNTYVGLVITTPVTDSMTGTTITEPTVGGYARKQVNINGGASPTWDLADVNGIVDNTHSVDLGPASGAAWGTVIAVVICSAATLGDLLFYDNGMADQAVGDGDTVRFAVGDLDIQMS